MPLSSSHAPHIEAGVLIEEEVHVTIVEVHVPCVGGIVGIRSRRPVVCRLHILSAHFSPYLPEHVAYLRERIHRRMIPLYGVHASCMNMPGKAGQTHHDETWHTPR